MTDTAQMLERIHTAMLAADINQAALAQELGLDKSAVSLLLKGRRKVSAAELGVIADALNVRVDDLLGRTTKAPQLLATAARLGQAADGGAIDVTLRRAKDLLETKNLLRRVMVAADRDPRPDFSPAVTNYNIGDGERAAAQLRELTGLGDAPIDDVEEFIQSVFDVDVCLEPMTDDMYGLLISDTENDVAIIFVNSDTRLGRQRFTAAHELGHLLFGDQELFLPEYKKARNPKETRANAFAAALLMPKQPLKDLAAKHLAASRDEAHLQALAAEVMNTFWVSLEATGYRLMNIGCITEAERVNLNSTKATRLLQPEVSERADARYGVVIPPAQVQELALGAYVESVMGIGTLARLWKTTDEEGLARELREAGLVPATELALS